MVLEVDQQGYKKKELFKRIAFFLSSGACLKLSQLNRKLPTFFKMFLSEKNQHKVGNPSDNFKCTLLLPNSFTFA